MTKIEPHVTFEVIKTGVFNTGAFCYITWIKGVLTAVTVLGTIAFITL